MGYKVGTNVIMSTDACTSLWETEGGGRGVACQYVSHGTPCGVSKIVDPKTTIPGGNLGLLFRTSQYPKIMTKNVINIVTASTIISRSDNSKLCAQRFYVAEETFPQSVYHQCLEEQSLS